MRSFKRIIAALDNILQRDIEVVFNEKSIRKGTLLLYNTKDYYLTIIIKTPKTNKSYDILYPFDTEITDDKITLDYSLEKLSLDNSDSLKELFSDVDISGSNKFLNHQLHICVK
jgi:hypothetical protein